MPIPTHNEITHAGGHTVTPDLRTKLPFEQAGLVKWLTGRLCRAFDPKEKACKQRWLADKRAGAEAAANATERRFHLGPLTGPTTIRGWVRTRRRLPFAANTSACPGPEYVFCERLPGKMTAMAGQPGPGRKSKGDRDAFYTRPMRPVGERVRANAEALGMDFGEYISAVLAEHVGLPHLAPQPRGTNQQELPLKTA